MVGTLGTGAVSGDLPVLAWAVADAASTASQRAWSAAMAHPLLAGSTRPREAKAYPAMFRYLGWCSWEEYRFEISEDVLLDAVAGIGESGLPIRYALIDDGHLDFVVPEGETNPHRGKLRSFRPNAAKFPRGWSPIVAQRDPEGLRWFGLWLNFNGYWNGLAPVGTSELGLDEHLAEQPGGGVQPRGAWLSSLAFYDAMIGAARAAGFDFVKVDNQSANLRFYAGADQPVEAAAQNQRALEAACAHHMDGLINCMAHNNLCVFGSRVSAVNRCSEDYLLNDAWRAKAHLHNSYANMLWMGSTVWGDHDMFHANDKFAGGVMARSKALSGGPVYVSDNPRSLTGDLPQRLVRPLCYEDGLLLRPTAPATVLPDSVFVDPFHDGKALRVVAPLPGGAAAVCVYNLTEPTTPVRGVVKAEDYIEAGRLEGGDGWALPAEGLVAFDWKAQTAAVLTDDAAVEIAGFDDHLALLCPIRSGWAVIGRADKYLSPAAAEVLAASERELIVRLHESGPLTVWSGGGQPKCDAAAVRETGGAWVVDLPVRAESVVVRLVR